MTRNWLGRRRWSLRLRDDAGQEAWLVITVLPNSGVIRASVGTTTLRLTPADISRIRQAYLEAQALALRERGEW